MTSAWDHYGKAERPSESPASEQPAAVPERSRHVSVQQGDVLHLDDGAAYVVTGMITLGAPARELTLHLRPADG